MQERNLYEYAIIRIVPKVEREEFLNIGVVLYCAKSKFLKAAFYVNESRLKAFTSALELDDLKQHLHIFDCICKGENCNSPIALLDPPSRFRWLTATRSTILQCSKVHPGLTQNPEETLNQLLEQFVK
jgi:hypothetical protein